MRHILAGALLIASVASAGAQSYQTALPVSPAERRALEARLSTILEFAEADEISRFQLPSGRSVTVLPYRKVNRNGGRPCRGYRIDLEGEQSRIAVDGFRCQRRNGQAWAIVEPELILAQEGLTDLRPTPGRERRGDDEPLYADDLFTAPPGEDTDQDTAQDAAPPLPRPAPSRDSETAAAGDTAPALATDRAPDDDSPFASRVAAILQDEPADEPEEVTPPPAPPAPAAEAPARRETETPAAPRRQAAAERQTRQERREAAQEQARLARRTVGEFTTEPTRVVSGADDTPDTDFSRNDDVVAGLQELDYLRADETATPQLVKDAVDAFAVDERFALPVSPDVLIARLEAAIERSETLPACTETSRADLCTLALD